MITLKVISPEKGFIHIFSKGPDTWTSIPGLKPLPIWPGKPLRLPGRLSVDCTTEIESLLIVLTEDSSTLSPMKEDLWWNNPGVKANKLLEFKCKD